MTDVDKPVTSAGHPPVLSYQTPGPKSSPWTIRIATLSPSTKALLAGCIVGSFCLLAGKRTVGPLLALALAACFTGIWWAVFRPPTCVWRGPWIRLQLHVAATAVCLATLVIFFRSGEAGEGPLGLSYWTTINRGYRYNPIYALRPWPYVAASLGWFLTVLSFTLIRERRAAGKSSAAPAACVTPTNAE